LYLRCSSCQKRSLYILTTLSDTLPCTNCKKPLTIYHWTGRVGKLNTFSITDLTSLFTTKYLKTHGFIMRKVNLWVKDILGTMCYVDFRGKKLPSFYAFSEKGAVEYSKLPDELKLMRKELLPYLDRPTTSDITKRHSRQDQISLTHAAPDPLELQSIIDELKTKGVDVLSHLKELNKLTVSQTEITKELNNTDDINKPKCPSCGSSNFSIVTNKLGGAERCADCDYLKITGGDEDERQGTGTSQKADDNKVEKRPGNLDDSFF
ncbi:hypothetical protein KAR91_81885, partial [Candidatus Pacearchaeota archaeon]|nr:hypothetical protein [Candidatus Pacearchaeota archaeon]